MRALVSVTPQPPHYPAIPDTAAAVLATVPTLAVLTLIHVLLAIMWTHFLPRIGVHTASYVALLAALSLLFGGLALWGALD